MAGKGDKPRIKNRIRYRANYDLIDWRRKKVKKNVALPVKRIYNI